MISLEIYKVIHLTSIFIFLSGAAVLLLAKPSAKLWKVVTGVATLLILVSGFGMLARLGLPGFPSWVIGKLVIWLAISALGHVVAKRFPGAAMQAYLATMAMASFAAWLAVFKPI